MFAQDDPSTQPKDQSDPLPSLDELLGLDEPKSEDKPISTERAAELDKMLTPREAGEAFTRAIDLMNKVASRIESDRDYSVTTQRLQDDILTMLDQIIESANENDSQSNSSSSSEEQQDRQSQPDQQQSQQGESNEPGDTSSSESVPGNGESSELIDQESPKGAQWGSLPKRVRDALTQGVSDQYSELYKSLTEAYYRALAESENE